MSASLLPLLYWLNAASGATPDPLCANRAPCALSETLDAGKDAQGQSLQVKHLSLGWAKISDVQDAQEAKFGGGRQEEGDRANGQCEAEEYWLLRGGKVTQLLLALCNDGYGASGIGEDSVEVGSNRITHTRFGGAGQRWTETRTLQLSPLEELKRNERSFFAGSPDQTTERTWEAWRLRGTVEVSAPDCEEDAEAAPAPYGKDDLSLPMLPRVAMDAAYVKEGWKRTGLGDCALAARFLVLGGKGPIRDDELKALLVAPDTVIIEVRDDRWTGPGKKWLADDHVELWLGTTPPEELNTCAAPGAEQQAVQWGIRIADDQVFPAHGAPAQPLGVEKVELREGKVLVGYRLKVTLPGPASALSVLYSDSDSGKKQERLLATSPLKFARPETLNPVREVSAEEATCVARDGALRVVVKPLVPKSMNQTP